MVRSLCATAFVVLGAAAAAEAQSLAVSIGVRETEAGGGASGGPIFSDTGGQGGGVEQVNIDGQGLTVDGTWQLFTFTPAADPLAPFVGTTANGLLDGAWGLLEHIRIRNTSGTTPPIRLWIDDVTNTTSAGPSVFGFEGFAIGAEVMFQEPRFSGTTVGNLLTTPNTAAVTDLVSFGGAQSYELNFQFIDKDTTRWVRLTTFQSDNQPNPAVLLAEALVPPFNPTISFRARAELAAEVPTLGPAALLLLTLALAATAARRLRRLGGAAG